MDLKCFRTKFGFEPRLHYYEAEHYLGGNTSQAINCGEIHGLVGKITALAFPTFEDEFDKRWDSFYLPLRRSGKIIAMPVYVGEYQRSYTASFRSLGVLQVSPGKEEAEEWLWQAFKEIQRFIPVLKKTENGVIEKTLPYDFRTGKIRGKYVLQGIFPNKTCEGLLKRYENRVFRQGAVTEISLEDYLKTAAICYRAAYGVKTNALTPEQMYKRWADGRHGGMLDIGGRKSRQAFGEWLRSGRSLGCHPFEIVFSWTEHGIHLYPPSHGEPCYRLFVTNYAFAGEFIKMLKALLKSKVPVEAPDLKEVLDYLAGESYFTVNDYDRHHIRYLHSKEDLKLFSHIEWDALSLLKWKRPSREVHAGGQKAHAPNL
ncbi:MAG: hypothetical protein V1708_05270 [Candidatus Micrarchaeota archaeon]